MSKYMGDPVKWEMWLRSEGFVTDTEQDPEALAVDLSYLEEEEMEGTVHTEEEFMDPRVIHIVHQLRQVKNEELYSEETFKMMEDAMTLFMATPSKEEATILSKAREEVTSRQVDDVLDDCLKSIGREINEQWRKDAEVKVAAFMEELRKLKE